MIIDSHIHLSHFLYDNTFPFVSIDGNEFTVSTGTRDQLIQQLKTAGIEACIDPGIDIISNHRLLCLAKQYPNFVYPAIGIHPTRTFQYSSVDANGKRTSSKLHWKQRSIIMEYANNEHIIAIGETGLDYHLARIEQHRFHQKIWFIWQILLAHKKRLPLILHIREADADALRILSLFRRYLHGGVCHCFSGSPKIAKRYIDLGFAIGIGGALLIKSPRQEALEQAVIQAPLDCILLETDGPYVKPAIPNLRKKQAIKTRNTSLILPAIVERIAILKGIAAKEVEETTTENAKRIFGLHVE